MPEATTEPSPAGPAVVRTFHRAPTVADEDRWSWRYQLFLFILGLALLCAGAAIALLVWPFVDDPLLYRGPLAAGLIVALASLVAKPEKLPALYLRGFGHSEETAARRNFSDSLAKRLNVVAIDHPDTNLGFVWPLWPVVLLVGIAGAWWSQAPEHAAWNALWFGLILGGLVFAPFEGALRGRLLPVLETTDDIDRFCAWWLQRSGRGASQRPSPWRWLLRRLVRSSVRVRTTEALWQQVVPRLAEHAAVIIVDVSSPGEGLVWEIERLAPRHASRMILVSKRHPLEVALQRAAAPAQETLRARFVAAVAGFPVLVDRAGFMRDHVLARELSLWACHVASRPAGWSLPPPALLEQRPDIASAFRWVVRALAVAAALAYLGWLGWWWWLRPAVVSPELAGLELRQAISPSWLTHLWAAMAAGWLWKQGE